MIIADNPLMGPDGKADGTNNSGAIQAVLQWDSIADASEYMIEVRKLGLDHTTTTWQQVANWPDYVVISPRKTFRWTNPGPVTTTLDNLIESEIYAIQVNYKRTDDLVVFAARDAYVWPSTVPPQNQSRVATFPFFGHHPNREFKYIICTETFPLADQTTWTNLIQHAFEQWEVATDGFVTVQETGGTCAQAARNSSPTREFLERDDSQSEVRGFDLQPNTAVTSFPEIKSDAFKVCLVNPGTLACVTSFHGYAGFEDSSRKEREDLAIAFEEFLDGDKSFDDFMHLDEVLKFIAKAYASTRQAENPLEGVDVSFNIHRLYDVPPSPLNVPGGNAQIDPREVVFNTCIMNGTPDPEDRAKNHPFALYSLAVHEAGHALGLSNVNFPNLTRQPIDIAHPTIPDSVLNYDDKLLNYYPAVGANFEEPDCSPHPFDIAAIYALYQWVPHISVEGEGEGAIGDEIQLTAKVSGAVPSYDVTWSVPSGQLTISGSGTTVRVTLPNTVPVSGSVYDVIATVIDSRRLEASTLFGIKVNVD